MPEFYVPVYFICSPSSPFQVFLEAESVVVAEPEVVVSAVAVSVPEVVSAAVV
jgi:hypothetical protein